MILSGADDFSSGADFSAPGSTGFAAESLAAAGALSKNIYCQTGIAGQ